MTKTARKTAESGKQVGVFLGSELLDKVERHVDKVRRATPVGVDVRLSDALRNLIERGLVASEADES